MLLSAVMDDLGAALGQINGLRVFPYWADRIAPPAAVVTWPDPLTFDAAMGRGGDRCEVPVIVLVGKVDARTSRDLLARYADGSGPQSVKRAIEEYEATAYASARVMRAEFEVMSVASLDYMAATFRVDIVGTGA